MVHKSQLQVIRATKLCTVATTIGGTAACQLLDITIMLSNLQVAPSFFENMCTPAYSTTHTHICICTLFSLNRTSATHCYTSWVLNISASTQQHSILNTSGNNQLANQHRHISLFFSFHVYNSCTRLKYIRYIVYCNYYSFISSTNTKLTFGYNDRFHVNLHT